MLELTVGEVHGTLQRDKGTVTFLGIKELETKRTFLDSVEGRVLWENSHTQCEATASQVYLGTGQIHRPVSYTHLTLPTTPYV